MSQGFTPEKKKRIVLKEHNDSKSSFYCIHRFGTTTRSTERSPDNIEHGSFRLPFEILLSEEDVEDKALRKAIRECPVHKNLTARILLALSWTPLLPFQLFGSSYSSTVKPTIIYYSLRPLGIAKGRSDLYFR